ncbi:AMP-binding protein [Streptomyces sp. NPDC015139]|uniref:AMP-binding protein n=1 Tax=Streptomyces sp. NPDC015139 TaxID=3364942 RepID=UPI0036FF727D
MTETAQVIRAYAVTGELDVPALRAAWHEAAARYRVPEGSARWFTDLGDLADAGPWEAAERLWADPEFLVFPAGSGPAALLAVARPAAGGHLLLLAVNRAFAAGGHRMATLVDALGAAYRAATGAADDPATAPFDFGTSAAAALRELADRTGSAPTDVLLAAFACLVGRQLGTARPVFAVRTPDGDRTTRTVDLSGTPTFHELVRRAAAQPAKDQEGRADAAFAVEGADEPVLRLPGARVRRLRAGGALPAEADPVLTVRTGGPALTGLLEHRPAPFDAAAAAGLRAQLRTLLDAALHDPSAPAGSLPLETEEEVRAAVRAADLTDSGGPAGPPVHERVRAVARAFPDTPALHGPGGSVTYRELADRAARVTDALRALGAGEGSPVALRLPNGPGQAAVLLGILGAGAHAVGLAPHDSGERVKAVLAGLRPRCLVVTEEQATAPLATWFRAERGGTVLSLPGLLAGRPAAVGAPGGAGGPSPSSPDTSRAADEAGRWAYVTYTSGSTGTPKGIPQTHRTFAQLVDWFTGEFGIGPGSRVAQWAQPGYDAGLVEAFAALSTGATLCTVPERIRAHPEKLAAWLESERITHFQTVPGFARELAAALRSSGARLPELRCFLLAGELLRGELAGALRAAAPGARVVNLYGATETVLATWHEAGPGTGDGAVPIGRPIPGRQVLVLDAHDRPCPAGVTGRIVVCGPFVTPGYLGPGLTDDAFRAVAGSAGPDIARSGCYRSGDLGRRRFDGLLEFRGRADARVKIHGTRLELTDVEAALAADPSVLSSAVVARTRADGLVDGLVAYVVPREEPAGTPAVWRATLRRWFGPGLPAVSFVTLPRLPHNPGGKVDRRALADLAAATR